eukprot:scaffold21750_cov128-Isochrysis_galbana.AAC.2
MARGGQARLGRAGRRERAGVGGRIPSSPPGAFPYISIYPFRGHEVACRLLQPLWGRQRPTAQSYNHTPTRTDAYIYVFASCGLTPPNGVWEGPRALIHPNPNPNPITNNNAR